MITFFLRLELYTAAAATQGDLLLEGGGLLTPPGSSQARATLKTTTVLPFDELVFLQMVTDTTYAHESLWQHIQCTQHRDMDLYFVLN